MHQDLRSDLEYHSPAEATQDRCAVKIARAVTEQAPRRGPIGPIKIVQRSIYPLATQFEDVAVPEGSAVGRRAKEVSGGIQKQGRSRTIDVLGGDEVEHRLVPGRIHFEHQVLVAATSGRHAIEVAQRVAGQTRLRIFSAETPSE